MKTAITACAVLITALGFSTSEASLITSSGDAALLGATVDDFSSYAVDTNPASVSDGIFTMTTATPSTTFLSVRDSFNGSYGIVGRSVVDYNGVGLNISFASPVSAFGIHLGAGDVDEDWILEAFNPAGTSLGSDFITGTVANNASGFFIGWKDVSIGSVTLLPSIGDVGIFDNLTYAVPEPATFGLMSIAGGALFFLRRRFRRP